MFRRQLWNGKAEPAATPPASQLPAESTTLRLPHLKPPDGAHDDDKPVIGVRYTPSGTVDRYVDYQSDDLSV